MDRKTGGPTNMRSEKEHFCFTQLALDKMYTQWWLETLRERDVFKLWTGLIWVKTWTNGQLL